MGFNPIPPGPDRKKWQIRGELYDGRIVKLPGHRDKHIAKKMCENIDSLNRSKMFGELPDPKLAEWIANLPEQQASRYIELGLLDRRLLDKQKPIDDLLKGFYDTTRVRCKPTSRTPDVNVGKIRRVFEDIDSFSTIDDLTSTKVMEAVNKMTIETGRRKGQPLAQKTRCEYFAVLKSFCKWMVKNKMTSVNPLEDLDASGAHRAPVRKRRPMRVAEFRRLVAHLRSCSPKYKGQQLPWTPKDRLMIYWTAVMTGLRAKELQSLTLSHVNFNASPVTVRVDGWIAKNSHSALIPIDRELATALKEYSVETASDEPLLRIPKFLDRLRTAFYRDLDAAGVKRVFEDSSRIDFHTLRSTAICWWITENKLSLVQVQHRARLKTLELVQKYVDDYAPDYAELVKGTPTILEYDDGSGDETGALVGAH